MVEYHPSILASFATRPYQIKYLHICIMFYSIPFLPVVSYSS